MQMLEKYEVNYGTMHPLFYYYLIVSTIVFLSVCKPPAFYKKIISWLMNRQVKISGSEFRFYHLLVLWILFLVVVMARNYLHLVLNYFNLISS